MKFSKFRTFVCFFLTFFFFTHCSKSSDRRCFKSTGKEDVKIVSVKGFTRLKLHKFIHFVLVQDSTDYVVVKAGENLINFIDITSNDGMLEITNKNTCDFLRSWKRDVKVFIHAKKITNIYFDGTETLTCSDTIKSDYFTFHQQESAGSVNLLLRSKIIQSSFNNSAGNLIISGTTDYFKVEMNGITSLNTCDLNVSDSIRFIQNSVREFSLNADLVALYGDINSSGNVNYKGMPSLIGVNILGKGSLNKLTD